MHPLQIVFILICLTLLAYGVLWCAEQIGRRVQRQAFRRVRPVGYVESRAEHLPVVASSPQTDAPRQQTDAPRQQTDAPPPKFEREQLLTHYRWLRSMDANREDARRHLKPFAIPVDNNLWAEAAPKPVAPDDPEIVTPYAGRRTKASYYPDDPDLEFRAPPQEAKAV